MWQCTVRCIANKLTILLSINTRNRVDDWPTIALLQNHCLPPMSFTFCFNDTKITLHSACQDLKPFQLGNAGHYEHVLLYCYDTMKRQMF